MVDQYYSKNYRLFKIPFTTLLGYHCPLGNSIKYWTTYLMMGHILAIRNDLQILNLSFTIIQLRKALNSLYSKIICRGSFLIYAEANQYVKIEHNATFVFVNRWLSGLLTNYKKLIKRITLNRAFRASFGSLILKRPQINALDATYTNPVPVARAITNPSTITLYARIPSISLSLRDSFIWLNECHNLKLPSIQLCDTQSMYNGITFPIISNQRSIPYTQLIINLFSETCNYALLMEHSVFTSYLKKTKK